MATFDPGAFDPGAFDTEEAAASFVVRQPRRVNVQIHRVFMPRIAQVQRSR